ncbi:MAG: SIS domain-containing protein [Bacteroidetes bacterium]|nr:SIS domain-containing protein [Bacteroidota bacterium]
MPLNTYKSKFQEFLNSEIINKQIFESVELVKKSKRIFFIGNGGSNSICSHMMEDYAKIANYPTFAFSDAALITCFANDYGFENAMAEWLKIHFTEGDLLVAISSSGNSPNINNAVDLVKELKGQIITLSGFEKINKLVGKGVINFWLDSSSYGIVECYHQTILHIILDELHANK